jgi:hypothetical protein
MRAGAAVLIAILAGCGPGLPGRIPETPSEELRATFGRIGIREARAPLTPSEIPAPPVGACDGAWRGAALGALVDAYATLTLMSVGLVLTPVAPLLPFYEAGVMALGLAVLPVATLIGALHGASKAADAEKVEAGLKAIQVALSRHSSEQTQAAAIVTRTRRESDVSIEVLGPDASDGQIDTLLEIDPPLLLWKGNMTLNPPLLLTVVGRVTLRTAADRRPLYSLTLAYPDKGPADFFIWSANDGAQVRSTLWRASESFAARLVEELFLQHPLPRDREWKRSPGP